MVFLVVDSSIGDLTCHRSATLRNLLDHPWPLNQLLKHALVVRRSRVNAMSADSSGAAPSAGATTSLTVSPTSHPAPDNGGITIPDVR